MSRFYLAKPEVPGGIGKYTIYNKEVVPWDIISFHAVFDGWLGSHLLKISPCFFVTEQLRIDIESSEVNGINSFQEMEVSKSETFLQLYPNRDLPKFYRLKIDGVFGEDDFGIRPNSKLILSEKALGIIKTYDIGNTVIEKL